MNKELSFPVVNLNGTSREELQRQCRDVYGAITNLEEQMRQMTPHGRDYQTVGFERYTLARDQHMERVRAIDAIKSDILTIYQTLYP